LVKRIEVLEKEKSKLASHLRGLESRIDKLVNESKKWKGSQKELDNSPHIIHSEEIQNDIERGSIVTVTDVAGKSSEPIHSEEIQGEVSKKE